MDNNEQAPNENQVSIEQARKVIETERNARVARAGKRIMEVLKEENCEMHFSIGFDSRNPSKTIIQRLIVPK